MAVSFTIPTYFTAIDKFSSPVVKMGRTMESFGAKAEAGIARSERAFRKMTPALSAATTQLLAFASVAAVTAGVIVTIKSVGDYETALASLSAITGVTGVEFDKFKVQVMAVAHQTERSAIEVAKAFEIVGSQQPELLKNAEALGIVTKAAITLARAGDMDLATSSKSLTGVMNQFSLGAGDAARVMNVLGAGAVAGGARIDEINEAMTNFGVVAKTANMSVEQTVAQIETLGRFSIKGGDAGTMLKTVIMRLQAAGLGYKSGLFNINDALAEAKAKMERLSTAKKKDAYLLELLERRGIVGGKILMNNTALTEKFTAAVTGTNKAEEMAETKSQTLGIAIDELKNAWINMVIGNDKATSSLENIKTAIRFVKNHLDTIVTVGVSVLAFFTAWWVLMKVARIGLILYNVAFGIYNALTGGSVFLTQGSTAAKYADLIVTNLMTAAQWALNAAMTANPLGLVIVAVALLAVGIYELIHAQEILDMAFLTGVEKSKAEQINKQREAVDKLTASYVKQGLTPNAAHEKAIESVKDIDNNRNAILNDNAVKAQKRVAAINPVWDFLNGSNDSKKANQEAKEAKGALEIGLATRAALVNPKEVQAQHLSNTINNNTKKEVIVTVKAAEGTQAHVSGDGASHVIPSSTSTMPLWMNK